MRGVLLCVQDFVRSPHSTERIFFSESALTKPSEPVAIADSSTSNPVYAPRSIVETACTGQAITDLRACWDRVVLRRRTAKDTSERCYHGDIPRSKTASRRGVRISDVVKEERAEYEPDVWHVLGPPGPSKSRSSPSKRKRKISRSTVKLPRIIEISSPSVSLQRRSLLENPSFASTLAAQASRLKWRRSERDRRAAPVLQMGFP